MKPFVLAEGIKKETLPNAKDVAARFGISIKRAECAIQKAVSGPVYLNDKYQVHVGRDFNEALGVVVIHLSIKRIGKEAIHDWRDLQQIKNELTDPEYDAIEMYPAESRLIDGANQYHLWVFASRDFRMPVGFNEGRQVSDISLGSSVNRPLDK